MRIWALPFIVLLSVNLNAQDIKCPSKKHIISKDHYTQGTKYASLHCMLDGEFDGPTKSWHPNGKLKSTGSYVDGEMDGLWKRWHDNGSKLDKGHWIDGVPDGKWTRWYNNGKVEQKGTFDLGEKIDVWKLYDRQGKERKIDFRNSQNDYSLSITPISEILIYSGDWTDGTAKYSTKEAFNVKLSWKHRFNAKWSSIVEGGMRQRGFDMENGEYQFESEGDAGPRFAFGAEYNSTKRIYGLMLESANDVFMRQGENFDPNNNTIKSFNHQNLSIRAYTEQSLYRGRRFSWNVVAGAKYIVNKSKDADEISNDEYAQPTWGYGADLKLEGRYRSSTKKSYFLNLIANYQHQGLKQLDTGIEYDTDRISVGMGAGMKYNFGIRESLTTKGKKNWIHLAFIPATEVIKYVSDINDSTGSYATSSANNVVISWERIFSNKWQAAATVELKNRTFDTGGDQYFYENNNETASSFILSLKRKNWGAHLGRSEKIFIRYINSKPDVTYTGLPSLALSYDRHLFDYKKFKIDFQSKATLYGPNVFDDTDEWMDDNGDGNNDNVLEVGLGVGLRVGLDAKYYLTPRKYIKAISFFEKEYQKITMTDTEAEFACWRTVAGLGVQYGYLF